MLQHHLTNRFSYTQAADSDPNIGGLGTQFSEASGSVQIAYESEGWKIAAIWSGVQSPADLVGGFGTRFTENNYFAGKNAFMNAWGIGGSWQPHNSGWIPSISGGYGFNSVVAKNDRNITASQSWNVGLQWSDVLLIGNSAGMAVGQPVFAISQKGGQTPADGNYVWEWWYQFQITDAISVTPAAFYLSRPLGQATNVDGEQKTFSQLGGLVKTTFRF